MFYHVAKGRHSSADEGRESRISRSDGRTSRVDSDDGRYSGAKRSRTPSTYRGGYIEDGENEEGIPFDEVLEEEEPLAEYIYVPQCMLGRPLKDFDSGQENTFVVVNNKLGKQSVFRFSKDKSLFLFGTTNTIRKLTVRIVTHQLFEIFILLTIITNCVFMALSDSPKEAEYVFAAIYTFEMMVKIIAKGFILHKYSYLRNTWNWLDFFVVIVGYVTMVPAMEKYSGVKTFRVLRALKTISTVKGLKAMVNTLLKSMRMMTDVLILTLFFIAIFALIGLQLFIGSLRSRCVPTNKNISAFDKSLYTKSEYWYKYNGEEVICGNASTAWQCPKNYVCVRGAGNNPKNGYISYDDFLVAMLTSLQVCTLDYWESVYNSVISAMGEVYMIYFLLAVFLGPFYLLNLVLAVVSASYEGEVNGNPDPEEEMRKRENIQRSASTYSFDGESVVEYLHGPSPVVEIDGEKQYTIDNLPKSEKKKAANVDSATEIRPPELGDTPSCFLRFRVIIYIFVGSTWFEGFITTCIMLNTIAMAVEHFKQPVIMDVISNVLNYIFTSIFVVEMICKLTALTPRGYARNKWNLFDGFLVLASLFDLILSELKLFNDSSSTLSVMRVFRLLRVLKLAQSWKTMGALLSTIGNSIGALGNITVILGIIIYIFAVVGMQLFGDKYTTKVFPKEVPRYNFKNFGNSFMMIFRILCGKWIEPQWDLLKATSAVSIIFIFMVFVIGRWVVLNLFLALLLSSFGGDALKNTDDEEGNAEKKSRLQRLIDWTKKRRKKKSQEIEKDPDGNMNEETADAFVASEQNGKNGKMNPINGMVMEMSQRNSQVNGHTNGNAAPANGILGNGNDLKPPPLNSHDSNNSLPFARNGNLQGMSDRPFSDSGVTDLAIQGNLDDNGSDNLGKEQPRGHSSSSVKIEIHRERTYVDDCFCTCCYSCTCCYTSYLDSPPRRLWHNIRYYAKITVENKYFEFLILFLIAFSSLTLVFEDIHLKENKNLDMFLKYCNYFFAIIFTAEFLIKLIGFGFIKYFTNLWNLLDVFIVAISLASLFGNPNLNALRSLRALRPLRAVSRFEGMKVVVNSLVHSIPSIANVLLVCGVFWLIFSVMGFQLFGGKFYRCVDKDQNLLPINVVNNKTECLLNQNVTQYSWVNRDINFDNSIYGLLALFQTATLEGWFEVMQDAYDNRGIDMQPERNHNFFTQIYFVVFIVLGAFFILNLFIGVIIDNFNRLKQQYEDGVGIYLTPGQRNWVNTLKSAAGKKPTRRLTRPTSKWRATLFDFVGTKQFELFIMSVIIANMLTMMIQHYDQSKEVEVALEYLNYLFTGIFTIEAIIRLIAMRLEYFKSFMNIFDFSVVLVSIGVIVFEKLKSGDANLDFSPGLLRVIRVFRLGRLLRFFDGAKGIRQLLFTIVKSAPALINIGTLLFLVMFIYAIMGMNFFMYVAETGAFNAIVNFKTFGSSFCLLFRISTAAGWNGVLEAAMVQPPKCSKTKQAALSNNHNCGSPLLAVIFFVSYIALIVLIMINMYIAVILENFNQAQSQDEAGITEDDLEAYYSVWEQFDPKATQFIKYYQLSDFMDALDDPLRVPKPNYWFLEENDIAVKDRHRVHCLDVMAPLIKRAIGDVEGGESEDFMSVMSKVEDRFRTAFPSRNKESTKITTAERLKIENAAARRIQKVFRRHMLISQIKQMTTNRNMTVRARERNQEQVEHLVTILWKNQISKNENGNGSDDSDADDNESTKK